MEVCLNIIVSRLPKKVKAMISPLSDEEEEWQTQEITDEVL